MSVDTKDQVQQFLILQNKTEMELKAICEGLNLITNLPKEKLIDQLLALESSYQSPVTSSQVIPLRSRNNDSILEQAVTAMKRWRYVIYHTKNNTKEFEMLTSQGKIYKLKMKYIKCAPSVAQMIINQGWALELPQYKVILGLLKTDPEKFETSIVQKPHKDGKSFLMLHVTPRRAS